MVRDCEGNHAFREAEEGRLIPILKAAGIKPE